MNVTSGGAGAGPELRVDWLGGNCPVQAEGWVKGKPFYFRARWDHWRVGVGGDPVSAPEWDRERPYADGEPFAAGWMDEKEAWGFLLTSLADYIAGKEP